MNLGIIRNLKLEGPSQSHAHTFAGWIAQGGVMCKIPDIGMVSQSIGQALKNFWEDTLFPEFLPY